MTKDDSQQAVISFLRNGAGGPDPADRQIDTQISHVFLIGGRAYKLKRAIKLPFLDYSTLDRRREACEKEVTINRRTAPDIYLGVRPIGRHGDELVFDARRDIVDYVVEMRRFDNDALFSQLIEADGLDPELILQLADRIASFHDEAEVRRDLGGASAMNKAFSDVAKTLEKADTSPLPADRIDAVRAAIARSLKADAGLIDARRRHGFVRHCHGDLHLGNICLYKGRPTPFDAIEFSDAIAVIDPLYDLAFTLMDLLAHGRRDFAVLLQNRYLEVRRDHRALQLMPAYIALRALIRTMSEALSAEKPDPDKACHYLSIADRAVQWRPRPMLLAVGGYSGTGKSTIARRLAVDCFPGTGAVVLRSDSIRKRLFARTPEEPLGEEGYGEGVSDRVYARIIKDARRTLAAGFPVIADATYISASRRAALADLARQMDVPFTAMWLEAPEDVLIDRIGERGRDASDADVAVLRGQLDTKTGPIDWHRLDCSGSLEETLRAAEAILHGTVAELET